MKRRNIYQLPRSGRRVEKYTCLGMNISKQGGGDWLNTDSKEIIHEN